MSAAIDSISSWLVAVGGVLASISLTAGAILEFGAYCADPRAEEMKIWGLIAGAGLAGCGGLLATATCLGGLIHG